MFNKSLSNKKLAIITLSVIASAIVLFLIHNSLLKMNKETSDVTIEGVNTELSFEKGEPIVIQYAHFRIINHAKSYKSQKILVKNITLNIGQTAQAILNYKLYKTNAAVELAHSFELKDSMDFTVSFPIIPIVPQYGKAISVTLEAECHGKSLSATSVINIVIDTP